MTGKPVPVALRFWNKVDKSGECWEWTASRSGNGYGQIIAEGSMRPAHRISYELAHGPLPRGVVVDHLCHNRTCVNPAHLRAVSHKQNMENRRGPSVSNKTGIRNVSRNKYGTYEVSVVHFGKKHHGGSHKTLEAAALAAARLRARLYTPTSFTEARAQRTEESITAYEQRKTA